MRRLGTPSDVGNAVSLFCAKEAGWITGQLVAVDGGMSLMDPGLPLAIVLRQGFILAAIGITSGVAVASAGTTLLESLLFGIRGLDPLTFGSACLILALVTLAASYIPARRAARVDPAEALRSE